MTPLNESAGRACIIAAIHDRLCRIAAALKVQVDPPVHLPHAARHRCSTENGGTVVRKLSAVAAAAASRP